MLTDDWQPIETAPQDGTYILAIRAAPSHDQTIPNIIVWNPWLTNWADNYAPDARPVLHQPTHWMPLPPPPMEQTNPTD
jgi:hypothetical protein